MFKNIILALFFFMATVSLLSMENGTSNSKNITSQLRTILDATQKTQNNELTKRAYTVAVESNNTAEKFQDNFTREQLQTIGNLCAQHLITTYPSNGYDEKSKNQFEKLLKDFMSVQNDTLRFRTATSLVQAPNLSACYKARLLFKLVYDEKSKQRYDAILVSLQNILKRVQAEEVEELAYICADDLTKVNTTKEKEHLLKIYKYLNSNKSTFEPHLGNFINIRMKVLETVVNDEMAAYNSSMRGSNRVFAHVFYV